MASTGNNVTATLRLKGQQAFGAGMRGATTSTKRLGSAMHSTSRLGISLGKGMARASVGVAGLGIAAGVAGFALASKFVAAAEDSDRVGRDTAATLKSTGNAARTTAKHVGDLATAISNKTGMDDEAIQSGANMLLTFTNIRNEVGKGNNVFDQATSTVADLAAKMGTDPSKAAIQLGKALNDPVKGITALTKVGVTFDDQQKKQIAGFVKAGKTAEAQKLILRELNKEFGGQAAAQSGSIGLLKTQVGNLEEQAGGYLLPYVQRLSKWLGTKGFAIVSAKLDQGVHLFGRVIRGVSDAFHRAQPYVQRFLSFVLPLVRIAQRNEVGQIGKGVDSFNASLRRNSPWLKQFTEGLRNGLVKYGPTIAAVIGKLAALQMRGLITGLGYTLDGVKYLSLGFVWLSRTVINTLGTVLHASAQAFGWVPGLGDKLKAADKSFSDFRKTANAELDKVQTVLTLTVDTRSAEQKLAGVGGISFEAGSTAGEKAQGRARAAASAASAKRTDIALNVDGRDLAKATDKGAKKNKAWR